MMILKLKERYFILGNARGLYIYIYICVCVCVCVFIYLYTHMRVDQ